MLHCSIAAIRNKSLILLVVSVQEHPQKTLILYAILSMSPLRKITGEAYLLVNVPPHTI